MTPLEINIILHYYCTSIEDYPVKERIVSTVKEVLVYYVNKGLLKETGKSKSLVQYKITEMGNLYVKDLMTVPLPKVMELMCIGCNKIPEEILEYINMGNQLNISPSDFVRSEEDNYNPENGHFLCTPCYIKEWTPSSPRSWRAP